MLKQTRNTTQKEIIKQTLFDSKGHMTSDEIYASVQTQLPNISRATVFRVLKQLYNQKEIGYIPVNHGADCYDYRVHKDYHFKCVKCNRLFDTDIPYDTNLDSKVKEFDVKYHVSVFYGVCNDCKE